ncbi:glycosyltransferase [Alkalilimnicola ehrlichii]|uniref:glycosyltransferase n=1 Tax=Alkalilimnicola ehrlichii TaxID=351052 RepID=UPI002162D556|nr:glycosyltransferase [Alkalilimnicola ehrlichii]
MRQLCRQADGLIAVSAGVADSISAISGIPATRIAVAPNPVISPDLYAQASKAPSHRWLQEGDSPVIVGMGGLRKQKDFATLIRAFAQLRAHKPCRLLIIGQGRQQGRLQALAYELGVAEDVDLPGFVERPYADLSRATVFALSSLWEGSPNALTEAMALGVPVVATDCPSGPRELLDNGRYGPLVPPADPQAMAAALDHCLTSPLPAHRLRAAVQAYTVDNSAHRYLQLLGLQSRKTPAVLC